MKRLSLITLALSLCAWLTGCGVMSQKSSYYTSVTASKPSQTSQS